MEQGTGGREQMIEAEGIKREYGSREQEALAGAEIELSVLGVVWVISFTMIG